VNQHVAMTGSDAEVQVNGVMFTEGRQHLSYHTRQHHLAPYCKAIFCTRWRCRIVRERFGAHDQGRQAGASGQMLISGTTNLMLSRDARADSIPGLEIEADDVRCTHGSTSGRWTSNRFFTP